MAEFNIALIPGDGIGPEIVSGAVTVLDAVSKKYGHKFNYQEVYMGGCAIDKYGVPLPQETVDICKKSDSVLLGAVGGPKWDSQPSENRPEKGLLGIRKALELYSNLRPSILKPQLKGVTVSVISMWVFRVAFCYLMVLKFHCGLLFIWLGMFLDWAMRSLFFCVRFVRGRWMEQKVI